MWVPDLRGAARTSHPAGRNNSLGRPAKSSYYQRGMALRRASFPPVLPLDLGPPQGPNPPAMGLRRQRIVRPRFAEALRPRADTIFLLALAVVLGGTVGCRAR